MDGCRKLRPPTEFDPLTVQHVASREFDHSSPYSGEIKNAWSYPSTSPVYFRGADRDKYIFFNRYVTKW
jgi:hypothetical protein